ncbi:MAG: EamA family transporter [Betaproteobacteria bacterium]
MELTFGVTMAVLGAGLLHAGWNALLKSAGGGDALLDTAMIIAGSTVCSLLVLPFVALPDRSAWALLAISMVIHFAYYLTLAQAYRTGDLSFAYPLMRGTAPLLVTVLGAVFLRELPEWHVILGILLISAGIISIAFVRREHHPPAAAYWAFANAAIIAVYTLIDGAGARASGNALSYVVWLTFLEGVLFLAWIRVRRGAPAISYLRNQWRRGLLGGFCSVAAYSIVLWAMTRAPVAAVSALRETSVIFAALIGALWLKEGFGFARLAGAATVVVGVATLKL